jgi:hypothetical protein
LGNGQPETNISTFLNNSWVKKAIIRGFRKYVDLEENKT